MTTKSEPGFTPGPWIYRERSGDIGVVDRSDTQSYGMLSVVAHMDKFDFSEHKANANLVAAAPELYAAVENLIAAITPLHNAHFQIERECISDKDVEDAQAAVREAELVLAKARGERHEI